MSFDRFVGVDWSGAKPPGYAGIAVASCRPGRAAPVCMSPPKARRWSRQLVFDWLAEVSRHERLLVGFDFSPALPFADTGAYLPGWSPAPADAFTLWEEIERVCRDDDDFYGGAFPKGAGIERHFWHTGPRPSGFEERLRAAERMCRDQGLGRAESVFKLVGARQVGLGSLAGMRLLRALRALGRFDVWPLSGLEASAERLSVCVEAFPRLFLIRAGAGHLKARTVGDLAPVWAYYDSLAPDEAALETADDHAFDALASAAALRQEAAIEDNWRPGGLSDAIVRTEGWIFGLR